MLEGGEKKFIGSEQKSINFDIGKKSMDFFFSFFEICYSVMVQYHALGLMYHIKKTDRLAVTKLVAKLTRSSMKSPFAVCMLVSTVPPRCNNLSISRPERLISPSKKLLHRFSLRRSESPANCWRKRTTAICRTVRYSTTSRTVCVTNRKRSYTRRRTQS